MAGITGCQWSVTWFQGSKFSVQRFSIEHQASQWPAASDQKLDARCLTSDACALLLKLTETIVESLAVHQLGMGAGFDDAAPVQDDDPVGMAYRG